MLYYYDEEKLEYVRINFKPLFLTLVLVLAVSFGFRYLYFDAEIITTIDFRGKGYKITIEQHLQQQKIEKKYDNDLKKYYAK